MSFYPALLRLYHRIPLSWRRRLRLTRFTASRRARARLWKRTGGRVAAGPFAGMRLGGVTPDDCYGPELSGAYECETHRWIENEIKRGWPHVVNVGSGTGFYSTGLALRIPDAAVHAFELDDVARAESVRAAERNGIASRVAVHGAATTAALAALPIERAMIVVDCEGAERELLDPGIVPWLANSAIMVELHDFAAPGIAEALAGRFAGTHRIEVVAQERRDPGVWAARCGVPLRMASLLCEEHRPVHGVHTDARWMLMVPARLPARAAGAEPAT